VSYYQGDYYMAGGFFSKLVKGVTKVVSKTSTLAGKLAPLVTAVNPAIGMGLSSYAQVGGRLGEMFTPAAAPAGLPMEGSPPAALAYQAATYGGMDPLAMRYLVAQMMMSQRPRRRVRRRRRY